MPPHKPIFDMENKLSAKDKATAAAAGSVLHRNIQAAENNTTTTPANSSGDTEPRQSKEIQKDKPYEYEPQIPPSAKNRSKDKDKGRSL